MSRLARRVLLLVLAASLALPLAAEAAPADRGSDYPLAAVGDWLARLWQPVSRLLDRSEGSYGPHIDPNGASAADYGPYIDPNGAEADGGPHIDPNGASAPPPSAPAEESAADGGPDIDPNG